MARILVVDDTQFWRELVADGLRLKGHTVSQAGDGVQAMVALKKDSADLVVLDVEMPNLEGLGFMEQVRRAPAFRNLPIIMLTGDMKREHVLLARQLGATDYLLKSRFSLSELVDRVERQLIKIVPVALNEPVLAQRSVNADLKSQHAASVPPTEIPHLLTHQESLDRAANALHGCTLSGVVTQVLATAMSPRLDMADLVKMVSRDPLIAAMVIQASNKVSYASSRGVISSVDEAVRVLGSAAVRDIAASIGIYEAMPPMEPDGYESIRCWQHSIAVARLCDRLAPEHLRASAYLVGLCHDLGEILFRTHFGNEYRHLLELQRTAGLPRHVMERKMLGMTRTELMVTIFQHFGLPTIVQSPIVELHNALATGTVVRDPIARVLQIADIEAAGLSLGSSLSHAECRSATGNENPTIGDVKEFRAEIYVLTAHFARLSPADQRKLMRGQNAGKSTKVWLARESSFSTLDPIAALLSSNAEVTVSTRLPTDAEMKTHQAIVVVTRSGTAAGLAPADLSARFPQTSSGATPVVYLTGKDAQLQFPTAGTLVHQTWPLPAAVLLELLKLSH
jgi:CheY-like chemotaxis protein